MGVRTGIPRSCDLSIPLRIAQELRGGAVYVHILPFSVRNERSIHGVLKYSAEFRFVCAQRHFCSLAVADVFGNNQDGAFPSLMPAEDESMGGDLHIYDLSVFLMVPPLTGGLSGRDVLA